MASGGFSEFQETIQKTIGMLKEIEEEFGWPEERRGQSLAALRTVLHTLRDRLTVPQSAKLAAQLPSLVRGIYYDGWVPAKVPRKMNKDEFLNEIRQQFLYSVEGSFEQFVRRVLGVVKRHVSAGEIDDVKSDLPEDIRSLFG
jgi:uncharacterized protein (DUF2267 family)